MASTEECQSDHLLVADPTSLLTASIYLASNEHYISQKIAGPPEQPFNKQVHGGVGCIAVFISASQREGINPELPFFAFLPGRSSMLAAIMTPC